MATWNRFSDEVQRARQTVRAYGLDRFVDAVPCGDSYKAQALRELAMWLEYEALVKELRADIAAMTDKLEAQDVK